MPSGTPEIDPRRLLLARAAVACTLTAFSFAGIHFARGTAGSLQAALLCILLGVVTAISARVYASPRFRSYLPLVYFNAIFDAVIVQAIAWSDGGVTSPLFAYAYAVPLCYGVL